MKKIDFWCIFYTFILFSLFFVYFYISIKTHKKGAFCLNYMHD